jgi:RHS repeat-associated protein
MTIFPSRAQALFATLLFLSLLAVAPHAKAASACSENGGGMDCRPPVPLSDWRHDLCDDAPPMIYRAAAWCELRGGFWNGALAACQGSLSAITAGNALASATAFEQRIHPPPECFGGGPAPVMGCSNYQCRCQNVSFGPVPVETFELLPFSGRGVQSDGSCAPAGFGWSEIVVHRMTRDAGCPAGYFLGTGNDGGPECYLPKPCEKCGGNPIEISSGQKRQRESDYQSPAPGGLSFVRYYNSGGFFSLTARDLKNSDVWRHNYSAQIVERPGNAYVMATAVRPSGVTRDFNLSGVEMNNVDGAAYRLQRLADGAGSTTGWVLTTDENDVEAYDAQGRLVSITTRTGFVTSLAYDAEADLSTVTDTFGRSLVFTYDTAGNMSTMTDPSGRVYQYGYDASGRLSTVTYPDTHTRTYLYEDAVWRFGLTGIVDERGMRYATYAYDSQGRAISTEHAGSDNRFTVLGRTKYPTEVQVTASDAFNTGLTYRFAIINGTFKTTTEGNSVLGSETRTYDTNGNPATLTDRRGTVTSYVYDPVRNLETSRTEAYGTSLARTITTTWDPVYRLPATITQPSGLAGVNRVTTFTRDSAGNVLAKNMTAGSNSREWSYTYNARGQVVTIDGPRTDVTDVTTIAYYADDDPCTGCRGQVHTATNGASQVTTFGAYDLDGRPAQITDSNGVATTLTYKPRGWLESRTTAGETTIYDYDPVGNLIKVTLPDSSWVQYVYDDASRMIGVDDSSGNAIDYTLDAMGNRVLENVYDPAGELKRTLQRLYDQNNRLRNDIGAASQTTTYDYDSNNNLKKITDPLNGITTNTYDALNRLTNITDATNGNTVFTYDANDHLKTVKDPKLSAATTYNYDGLGNLASQISPDTGTTTFTYDAAGNIATLTDARGAVTTYTYDVLNRVTAASVTDGAVAYEYDNTVTGGPYAMGRLTKVTDPSGATAYVYDALGRVTSKAQTVTASPANRTFAVAYAYADGRQTGITYPSGHVIVYGFDSGGHIASIAIDGTSVLTTVRYFPFGGASRWTWGNGEPYTRTFDLDGRVKSITMGPAAGSYPDLSELFTYDSLNRLISANLGPGQTQSFTYDANGNRTNATVNAASTTYTYPSTSHRLTSLSGATARSFGYDNAGNVTSSAGITYTYDGRGRMKQAGTTSYAVNGLGQRVKKNNGTDTFFAYDEAGHLIGEYDATGVPIEETVWLGDLPVAVVKPNATSFDVFYVWPDHLGTPRLITDAANQSRWEWPNADPFGNNLPNENPAGLGVFTYNLRFPGQYYDQESGTYYNYFRDYDPSIGRYIESDPIGLRGGLNTYVYVRSPLTDIDPLGQMGDRGGDEAPDTKPCAYYSKMCNSTGGSCGYYCRTAPFVCSVGYRGFVGISNRSLNCVRRCLVDEDAKAQSGHGFGAGPGSGSGSSSGSCRGPHCLPDHVIDAYHKKCFMQCGVDPNRYPGVNPFGAAPNSPLNPNQGGQP